MARSKIKRSGKAFRRLPDGRLVRRRKAAAPLTREQIRKLLFGES